MKFLEYMYLKYSASGRVEFFSKHYKLSEVVSQEVTVQILCIGTDRSQQTVQTKMRLLPKKQSDQGLRCLPFHQHLLDALKQCYIKFFYV